MPARLPSAGPASVRPEEQLEREAARRTPAAIAAIAAVVLQIAAQIVGATALRDAPVGSPGAALELPRFIHEHAVGQIVSGVLLALSQLALIPALLHLFDATRARRPGLPAVVRAIVFLGPVLLAVLYAALPIVVVSQASSYLAHHQADYFAARELGRTGIGRILPGLGQAGGLALGFALILVSINAMRVGLLTRFMGILGIIVAIPFVLPFFTGSFLPLQWFWLVALALLFLGRWPGGQPAAWLTGHAEPWPSARELRERRQREGAVSDAAGEGTDDPGVAAEAQPPAPRGPGAAAPGPARRTRKRKRR